jgi:hypothetical protein
MTLVVARVTPLGVRMAADMRITDEGGTKRGYVHGALKLVMLSPTLCVGYAGNIDFALHAIREVASADLDFDAAQGRLVDAHRRSIGASATSECQFLVAGLRPSRLIEIKDGQGRPCEAGLIGDASAAGDYQAAYFGEQWIPPRALFETAAQADDVEIASRMKTAMDAVVEGPISSGEGDERVLTLPEGGRHETVGEAVVMVNPRAEDGLFVYQTASHAQAPPFPPPLPPGLGVVPADFGSAERGSFAYSVLHPRQPGVAVLGIYFHEGRLGLLYAPLLFDRAERKPDQRNPYSNVSLEQFVELVRLRHDIYLAGFGIPA